MYSIRVVLFLLIISLFILPSDLSAQTISYPTIQLSVYYNSTFWDNWKLLFKPGTREVAGDNGDLNKISNAQFNIYSLSQDSVQLNFDARDPDSMADGDVVRLGISSIPLITFTLVVTQYTIPDNRAIYLHDNYTGSNILLDSGTTYSFSITSDAASQGDHRMSLTFSETQYYSAATGNLNDVSTFGSNKDGSGLHPTNFLASNKTYHIANNNPGILGADWLVSGTGTAVVTDTSFTIATHNVNAKITVQTGKTISVLAGSTLTTNDSLVLLPGARIGTVAGAISGNVVIETKLNGQRGYRFLGHPFTTGQDITMLGNFFDITGITAGNIGICNTRNPSLYSYTPGPAPTYTGITATGTGTFPAAASGSTHGNGLLAFVRGAQGQGCSSYGTYTPSAVTIATTGMINIGGVAETVPAYGWNLICNPLPSQITINGITNSNNLDAFEVLNPGGQNGGILSQNGSQYISASSSSIIPINGAFLAHNPTGSDVTLIFPESAKTSGTPVTNIFKTTNAFPTLGLSVYYKTYMWDAWTLQIKPGTGATATDNGDLGKMANAQFDLYSLSSDNALLSMDARAADSLGGIVPLGIRSLVQDTFTIQVSDYSFPANKTVYLHDKYLNAYVQLNNGTSYPFIVNTDTASQGPNRLELVFPDAGNTGIGDLTGAVQGITIAPDPASNNISINYSEGYTGTKTISVVNIIGQVVKQLSTSANMVNIPVDELPCGVYMIRTNVCGKTVVSRFVKK